MKQTQVKIMRCEQIGGNAQGQEAKLNQTHREQDGQNRSGNKHRIRCKTGVTFEQQDTKKEAKNTRSIQKDRREINISLTYQFFPQKNFEIQYNSKISCIHLI